MAYLVHPKPGILNILFVIGAAVTAPTFGEAQQPYLLKDIQPGAEYSTPFQLTLVGDQVFFTAIDGVTGFELWVTDGTEEGTHLVKDIVPGSETILYPRALTVVGDRLFFRADDGINGVELWVSDGTSQGTYGQGHQPFWRLQSRELGGNT